MIQQDDMSLRQGDNAIFLPSISSFYAFYIGRQRFSEYVPKARIPSTLQNGVEGLNFLNKEDSYFYYPWALYSAGHANLDPTFDAKEDMVRNRDPRSWLLGDSGGYQIGKGVWEGDWKDPNCPKAGKKRADVLRWMDNYMDYGMTLDIPAWVCRSERGVAATGVSSYQEAVNATHINYQHWMKNRSGKCKFLNVLQGENHTEADDWYSQVKEYCDPVKYPGTHFNGWSMGGQNMCDLHLVLKRIVALAQDNLLQEGVHDYMHFLGTSKLEWACLLSDVQRSVRKHINPKFTITYDCASPFLANAKGLVYSSDRMIDRDKWTYSMEAGIDDKKYATDTRMYRDVAVNDGIIPDFTDSIISAALQVRDVCYYKPGDVNKVGREGRTSWDSFSYALQMAHNTWRHINAVLTANELYTQGVTPSMLVREVVDQTYVRDVIEDICANANSSKAYDIIDNHDKLWQHVVGQRGYTGKKTVNASTVFNSLFE